MLPNVVLFQGEDSNGRSELWETNGTAAGTLELTGVAGTSRTGLYPINLPYNADEALLGGADARGLDGLWETDGTAVGTHELTGHRRGGYDWCRIVPVRSHSVQRRSTVQWLRR